MANTSYFRGPPGIFKLVTGVIGIVVVGLAIAAWPRTVVRETVGEGSDVMSLWKFNFFFAFSIIALLFSVITVLLRAFVFTDKSTSIAVKLADVAGSILIGILLAVGGILLIFEIVERRDDLMWTCYDFYTDLTFPDIRSNPFTRFGIKSLENDAKALEKCLEKLPLPGNLGYLDYCTCSADVTYKLVINVVAGSAGIFNACLLVSAGVITFISRQ